MFERKNKKLIHKLKTNAFERDQLYTRIVFKVATNFVDIDIQIARIKNTVIVPKRLVSFHLQGVFLHKQLRHIRFFYQNP
jgi:predicted transport protein